MKQTRSRFNENLRYIRAINKLTQVDMAKKIGVKRSSLGAWEEGRGEPSLDKLGEISEALGISCDTLIREDMMANNLYQIEKPKEKKKKTSNGYTIPAFPDDPFAKEDYMNVLKTMIDQIYKKRL